MNTESLNNLINVRDFAVRNLDNIYFKLSTEEVRLLRAKIAEMDRVILAAIINLKDFTGSKAAALETKAAEPVKTEKPVVVADKAKVRRSTVEA